MNARAKGSQVKTSDASATAAVSLKLSEMDAEQIRNDIISIQSLLCSIRGLAGDAETNAHTEGIEALSEKAGFLTDRCSKALGGPAMYGAWEAWAQVKRSAA